ncbi:tryptophan synthase subunit alpha [Candidatus Woesearchaeota archaeon]|nr:tryptophan synthase subunit alpha [Candidatus Woesearchaeota archaeon]
MDDIKKTFATLKKSKEKALVPFIVIGDPDYQASLALAKAIARESDMLELGFAFSDPIADGPTIQAADQRAKRSGMSTKKDFQFIKELRKYTNKPINLLVYANLVYQQGIGNFYRQAKEAEVSSVLIADLPIEESTPYVKEAKRHGIMAVFTISPLTDRARIKAIAGKTTGFLYLIARLGVTGAKKTVEHSVFAMIKNIRSVTKLPIVVGFGISNKAQVHEICKAGADGVIVGSRLIQMIEKNKNNPKHLLANAAGFVRELKKGTKG